MRVPACRRVFRCGGACTRVEIRVQGCALRVHVYGCGVWVPVSVHVPVCMHVCAVFVYAVLCVWVVCAMCCVRRVVCMGCVRRVAFLRSVLCVCAMCCAFSLCTCCAFVLCC